MATLGPGDLVFTGYQASTIDKISFALLKSVDSGTVLTITDNAWTGSALSTSEGNSVITFGGSFAAGTQFNYDASRSAGLRWTVDSSTTNLSDVTGGNFALNASGDNLFAYNGSTPPTSGSSSAWVSAFASNAYLSSGSSTASLTLLPSVLASTHLSFSLGLPTGAANENGVYTAGSVTGTTAQIQNGVYSVENWTTFTAAGAQAIPPNAVFTVQSSGNSPPSGLALSNSTIAENAGSNAVVGSFTTTDPDLGNTFTYSLVSGIGSADNASFNISGNQLRATNSLDFETKSSYSIRVRTTDQSGLTFDRPFTIQVIDYNESLNLRLNELKVNPPGNTAAGNKFQYIELIGTPALSLNNTQLVMLDGNGATSGTAGYVIDLSTYALGSNGLLIIKSPTGGHNAAIGTSVVTDIQFDSPTGILSKQTVSFFLVTATDTFVQGHNYDLNRDGLLDNLPSGFSIIDHVGWSDGDVGDFVYGDVVLTQSQGTPAAATRIVGNTSVVTSAWFNGDLEAADNLPSQIVYAATRSSPNLPVSPIAFLTPGAVNFVDPAAVATTLRIVNYNLAAGSEPNMLRPGLATILQAIGSEVVAGISRPIDILAVQEIYSQANTSSAVAGLLNEIYGGGIYAHGVLNGNSSGSGTLGVVYNTQVLQLLGESAVGTVSTSGQARQTLRYHFQPLGGGEATDFYLYNSHWKAANDQDSRNRRQIEAQAIRANADALGNGKNIIYVGDYNLYAASELAFQTMIGVGNGQANDPINRLGSWSDNSSFIDVFTQSPAVSPPSGLVGGGLDDRFDFQLISGELMDGQGLDYRPGSYRTFGNNGSVSINTSINSSSSTALPGLANRMTVLNLLTTVTDHLPVVADYTLTTALFANQPPSGTDGFVTTDMNVPYTFTMADFGFSDPNNTPSNTFESVVIASLPTSGALTLDGQPVTVGQSISVSAIEAGNLKFTSAINATGTPYSSFSFQVRDNGGTANGGSNLDPSPNVLSINVNPIVLPAIRINEALINPSDADDVREFVELIRLSPNETLDNVWLLELETDHATGRGTIDFALPLSSANFGSNDLLLIGHNYQTSTPYSVPAATGRFNLNRPGSTTIENSVNLLLVYQFSGSVGVDYDANDDGILDTLPWIAVIDAVAMAAEHEPAYQPGTRILNSDNNGVVDAVVRLPGVTEAATSTAFYGGKILDTGNGAIDLQFQMAPGRTANFPAGGILTPGDHNAPESNAQVVAAYIYHAHSSLASGGITSALDTSKMLAKQGPASQTLSFDNLINSARGINGIVFDIDKLPANAVTEADFQFQISPQGTFNEAANPPASWPAAPAPASVSVLPGSPKRVVIEWLDNVISNRWLRVTINSNANTGLAQSESYYLGHLLGETTGHSSGVYTVSFADATPIRSSVSQVVGPGSIYDIDKNGIVAFADITAMRSNISAQLTNITIPAVAGGENESLASRSRIEAAVSNDSDNSETSLTGLDVDVIQFQQLAYAAAVDIAFEDSFYSVSRLRKKR
ncbi:MAG: hypothetical protein KF752_12320 [Pirellulaceae bacterium]|nr:hypothetical protein [Pirellulaceae bacterium]